MAFVLTADQKVQVVAHVVDTNGNPISQDATPTFNTSDSAVLRLEPVTGNAFAISCVAVGPVGMATLTATIGGISSSLEFEIVAGGVARIELIAGTPEPK